MKGHRWPTREDVGAFDCLINCLASKADSLIRACPQIVFDCLVQRILFVLNHFFHLFREGVDSEK